MIISISGEKNSGKDLTGKIFQALINHPGISDSNLKYMLSENVVSTNSKAYIKKFATIPNECFKLITNCDYSEANREVKERLRPRFIQFCEMNKMIFGEDVWEKALFRDYIRFNKLSRSSRLGIVEGITESVYPTWIITDTRFPVEREAISKYPNIMVYVSRPNFSEEKKDVTETALKDFKFDYYIENTTIDSLILQVRAILTDKRF